MTNIKKVTVLTHRLGDNYGGILQAYALQRYVRSSLPNATVSTTHYNPAPGLIRRVVSTVGATVKRRRLYVNSLWVQNQIQTETRSFLLKYVNQVKILPQDSDVYIVGSDQVWRAQYVDPVKYMFGEVENGSAKRISYAASFGTDNLSEYSDEQIVRTAELAKKFNGISVRESSGVTIVKDDWGLEALHHVDPTLLLDRNDYSELIDSEPTEESADKLFAYVLDRGPQNNEIIKSIETLLGIEYFELMPKKYQSIVEFLRKKDEYIMPKVEQWLRSFRDADFIITDSFHGTVFSIIFNKPFIAIGNRERGLARFTSLLKIFGLEDRLVVSESDVTDELINRNIDWDSVNVTIKEEQKRSFEYLEKCLG